jgi:hypothetical protein
MHVRSLSTTHEGKEFGTISLPRYLVAGLGKADGRIYCTLSYFGCSMEFKFDVRRSDPRKREGAKSYEVYVIRLCIKYT